jgi:hypothetical protein
MKSQAASGIKKQSWLLQVTKKTNLITHEKTNFKAVFNKPQICCGFGRAIPDVVFMLSPIHQPANAKRRW